MVILRSRPALAAFLAFCAVPMPALAQQPPAPDPTHEGGRRAIMTGADADSARVRPAPVQTTVEDLLARPRPPDFGTDVANPAYQNHRADPVETTIWVVDAEIVSHQLMPDGDFRVILRGGSGKTVVMELPDPKAVPPTSRWAKEIAAVRRQFEEKYHPARQLRPATGRARITGVGFFGRTQLPGAAPREGNGVQLHPAVKLEWLLEDGPSGQ
jgi:hypothetical protein